jgi:hypothetical protein
MNESIFHKGAVLLFRNKDDSFKLIEITDVLPVPGCGAYNQCYDFKDVFGDYGEIDCGGSYFESRCYPAPKEMVLDHKLFPQPEVGEASKGAGQ